MLDKDSIISISVSEAVEKIPTDEKYMLLYVFYFGQLQQTKSTRTYIANSRNSCLHTRIHSVYLKKYVFTENILHKIYTEKGAMIGI